MDTITIAIKRDFSAAIVDGSNTAKSSRTGLRGSLR
jgi:hypothetical protein